MRALVLTGGGSFGAFQAGVVHGLASKGRQWDLVIGTSVGAINGAYLAQAPAEHHLRRTAGLCDLWEGIHEGLVYRQNWRGLVREVLPVPFLPYRPAVYSTKPLQSLIEREIAPTPPPTQLKVTAVAVDSGAVRIADARETDIRPWVQASSAIPVIFPPVEIEGRLWIDGGVRRNNPISEAIRSGATEIDVVLCYPMRRRFWHTPVIGKRWGLADIAALTFLYAAGEVLNGDVVSWRDHNNPPVRIYAPDEVPVMSPIAFKGDMIRQMIQHGREVAARP